MRKRILLAIAISSIAIILFAAVSVYDASPLIQNRFNFIIGVCTHGNKSSEMFAIKSGIKYFRTDITNTNQQISLLDEEHALGANYLGILDYSTLPNGLNNKNWSLNEWNESIEKAVTEYPWINTWEIWNEPYVNMFQTGYMNGSAYNYYIMIKSASKIIKEHNPNATIVCFGGAPIGNENVFLWYDEVWNYGSGKYCNAVSLHIYQNLPFSYGGLSSWASWIDAYENMTKKPIWITEFGMPSASAIIPGLTQKGQNYFLLESTFFFNKFTYIKRVYWYDLWGLSDGNAENNFGLLNLTNPEGRPSIAWYNFTKIYNSSNA
ncbi:MAG: glycosyl hydrolase [Candidatus Micrarchaeia archaeon]